MTDLEKFVDGLEGSEKAVASYRSKERVTLLLVQCGRRGDIEAQKVRSCWRTKPSGTKERKEEQREMASGGDTAHSQPTREWR